MKSIYCCGMHGHVGWVKGWSTDQSHPDKVTNVELTLCHHMAYRFDKSDQGNRDLGRVLDYVRAHDVTLGSPEVFCGEEP